MSTFNTMKLNVKLIVVLTTLMVLVVVCLMYTSVINVYLYDKVKILDSIGNIIITKAINQHQIKNMTNVSTRIWKFQLYEQTSKRQTTIYSRIPSKFLPLLNSGQYEMMLETWDEFTDTCYRNNITYILYRGSLLGSYRHHGLIPWDDDMDVIMKRDDITKLQKSVAVLKDFQIYRDVATFKFFKRHGKSIIRHQGFNWPFVDIFLYKENQTHLWDDGLYKGNIVWEKARYFPIQYRPFEDRLHPVPNDIVYGLEQEGKYNTHIMCISNNYDHKLDTETNTSDVESIKCKTLYQYYPFVQKVYKDYHIHELLMVNGTILNRFTYRVFQTKAMVSLL